MGLFGPSQPEKIRRTAAEAFPQADWNMEVDWSSGSKLHKLTGAVAESRTETEAMDMAKSAWKVVTKKFRLHPDDGFDGLLDVRVTSPGCCDQSTGINGA